jgi:pilus assembly protein TadC
MIPTPLLAGVLAFIGAIAAGRLLRGRAVTAPAMPGTSANPDIWRESTGAQGWHRSLSDRLRRAGFERTDAARTFMMINAACLLLGAAAGFRLGQVLSAQQLAAPYGALLGAFLGWRLPSWWLNARIERRRLAMQADFPIMLDLLQISMQGGMGLHAAWATSAATLEGSGELLAREMRQIDIAVGMGQPWGPALEEATERTGIAEFRSLGSLLGQTQRFGTGVADMIRVLCDSLRHDEVQALEELAHRRTVRMLTVLASVLLPATLMIIFLPLLFIALDALRGVTID